jgi:hypothetical protein
MYSRLTDAAASGMDAAAELLTRKKQRKSKKQSAKKPKKPKKPKAKKRK